MEPAYRLLSAATLRHRAQQRLSVYPPVFLPLARLRYRNLDNRVVSAGTELVIEGFPRSGNTFAVTAFDMAQDRPVRVVHHLHSAAQVMEAVRVGIPTILLVREPADCTLSRALRTPRISVRQALGDWVRFHERVIPLLGGIVVADFSIATSDFGAVIRRVNERFGTDFREFEHTQENVSECFERITKGNLEQFGGLVEMAIARPSTERDEAKRRLRAEFESERLARLRLRAASLYRTIASASVEIPSAGHEP